MGGRSPRRGASHYVSFRGRRRRVTTTLPLQGARNTLDTFYHMIETPQTTCTSPSMWYLDMDMRAMHTCGARTAYAIWRHMARAYRQNNLISAGWVPSAARDNAPDELAHNVAAAPAFGETLEQLRQATTSRPLPPLPQLADACVVRCQREDDLALELGNTTRGASRPRSAPPSSNERLQRERFLHLEAPLRRPLPGSLARPPPMTVASCRSRLRRRRARRNCSSARAGDRAPRRSQRTALRPARCGRGGCAFNARRRRT